MKRNVLLLFSLLGVFAAIVPAVGNAQAKQPNVLFILIDDFGWRDVGYNGSTFYETPQIDKLSKQWMRFDSFYTPSPMCSPTRTSILTGKNPARHGVTQWLPGNTEGFVREGESYNVFCPKPQSPALQDSDVTLGEAFREAGYETAFYGKWHMANLKGGTKQHGYDEQKAIIYGNGCRMFYPFTPNGKLIKGKPQYFPDAKEGDYFTDLLTDAAIEYVTRQRDQPFYLHLCHFAMHSPIKAKPELRKKYEAKAKLLPKEAHERFLDPYGHQPYNIHQHEPEYAGELENLDTNIGRLIQALKDSGQYENTIVVFTGDNGGRSASKYATSNAPLRAGKTYLFEGGLLTPTLIHWPGHTKPGMSTNAPATSMDFYPTLLEMVGLPPRPEQHVDGVSLVPLFEGLELKRDTLYWHFPHYQGEGAYPASAIRVGDYKLVHNYHHGDLLLYDLQNDPYEEKNLADTMPEKTQAMNRQLMTYLKENEAYLPKWSRSQIRIG